MLRLWTSYKCDTLIELPKHSFRCWYLQKKKKIFQQATQCPHLDVPIKEFAEEFFANVDGPVPQVQGRPETAGKTLDFGILAGLQKIASYKWE